MLADIFKFLLTRIGWKTEEGTGKVEC